MEMKNAVISLILALFLISIGYAYETPENSDYWKKVHQLDQLEERFKAETGFTGNINYYYERMKLGSYEGKFADIPFSADADTSTFRQACERILDKILPYSYAKYSQLSMSRITRRTGYISTDYYQQVNGYRVEGLGFIVITYDAGRYRFSIGDNAVELPEENDGAIISEEEAISIANEHFLSNKEPLNRPSRIKLAYTNGKYTQSKEYYLCYIIYMGSVVCVDANTGEIRFTWDIESVHTSGNFSTTE
jgi:Zn-dependent metalloprotease